MGCMNSRILTLLLLGFASAVMATPNDDQRARFKAAYAEAQAGGPRLAALANGLEPYLLYPYLRFETLKRQLPDLPVADVETFLDANRGTFLAGRMREEWLRELGKQHQWALYERFYQLTTKTDLACIALRAQFELGKLKSLNEAARTLWASAKSSSDACSPAF